jgi:hypothetical protein
VAQIEINAQDERLLSPEETARLLGVSIYTLREWRGSQGRGPDYVKVAAQIKYPVAALCEYLEGRVRRRTPPDPFYRRTLIEALGEKHLGLCKLVEEAIGRRIPYPQIAAEIRERWGERVSPQALSNFYRRRVWAKKFEPK